MGIESTKINILNLNDDVTDIESRTTTLESEVNVIPTFTSSSLPPTAAGNDGDQWFVYNDSNQIDHVLTRAGGSWKIVTGTTTATKVVARVPSASGASYFLSFDGLVWQTLSLPSSSTWRIAYGSNRFVAVNTDGTESLISENGITWTSHSIPNSQTVRYFIFAGGNFLALSSTYSKLSTDGVTWTMGTNAASRNWDAPAYNGSTYVAIIGGTQRKSQYSTNGLVWTQRSIPVFGANPYYATAWGAGRFVSVGNSREVTISTDGITWTHTTAPYGTYTSYWFDIIFANNKFVMVAGSYPYRTRVGVSTNGITWTDSTLPFAADWRKIIWFNNQYYVYGQGLSYPVVPSSTDGITWTMNTMSASISAFNVEFGTVSYV